MAGGPLPMHVGDLSTSKKMGLGGCCGLIFVFIVVMFSLCMANYAHLGPDDQVRTRTGRNYSVTNGPQALQLNPFKSHEYRKATILDPLQYAVVQDRISLAKRHVQGPQLFFPLADDTVLEVKAKDILERDQYIRLIDRLTGLDRILYGPAAIVPEPTEFSQDGAQKAVFLTMDRAVVVLNRTSGMQRLVTSCNHPSGLFMPDKTEEVLTTRKIVRVLPHEAMIVRDVSGIVTIYSGRHSNNVMSGEGNCVSGDTAQGPGGTAFFLPPYDRIVRMMWSSYASPEEARAAIKTVEDPAPARVLQGEAASTTDSMDTPYNPDENVETSSQKPAPTPAPVGSARYVMPMYVDQNVPALHSGPKKQVVAIDLRVQKSFYSYEVRTNDNVKLRLEGTIFWEIFSVAKMVNGTSDPEGDVWHRSRSVLVQAVSSKTFGVLMQGMNSIMSEAESIFASDNFYKDRGLNLLSMEMTKFEPVDQTTATVLRDIIRETTKRINDLQKQKSNNEVRLEKLSADIALEANRTLLIEQMALNTRLQAETQGATEGGKQAFAIASFMDNLNSTMPNVTNRIELFQHQAQLNKSTVDAINLAGGNGSLFITPQDMELRLQMPHNGEM